MTLPLLQIALLSGLTSQTGIAAPDMLAEPASSPAEALFGILVYAASLHVVYWARNRHRWARATVDFLARVSRHEEDVVLIWAWIADALAIVALIFWWRSW